MVRASETRMPLALRIEITASYTMRLSFLLAAFSPLITGRWLTGALGLFALFLSYFPAFLERNFRILLPIEFEVMFVSFLYASIFLGEGFGFYLRFPWWDLLLHAMSGILLGMVGFILVYVLSDQNRLRASAFLIAMFSFCFAMALGCLWEIFEFCMDHFFGLNMQKSGLMDTMSDLIVDCCGALFTSLGGYLYLRFHQRSLFRRLVESFLRKNPRLFRKSRKKGPKTN